MILENFKRTIHIIWRIDMRLFLKSKIKNILLINFFFILCVEVCLASDSLNGKALLCSSPSYFGVIFKNGKTINYQIIGYEIKISRPYFYHLKGASKIEMRHATGRYKLLNRETLEWGESRCSLSSREEIETTLGKIIKRAKSKNKF